MKRWTQAGLMALVAALLVTGLAACSMWGTGGNEPTPTPSAGGAPAETAGMPQATGEPQKKAELPKIPEKLELEDGVPELKVYDVDGKELETMDIERYVEGVLAGEMRNDWPMEALKAQAILARTFVLKFVEEKSSRYEGADISTDIGEAQAYDAEKINDRIKKAVAETRGEVLSASGELPYAWFHAHAGGKTELAQPGLEYKKDEPSYTQVVDSPESDAAPTNVKNWTVTFDASEVVRAAKDAGLSVDKLSSIAVGKKSESGRAVTILINQQPVSAPALRLQLDGKVFKSTLIKDITLKGGKVTVSGSGYGHGVGMSQWGAYGLAEQGKAAEDIVKYYFKDVDVVKLWS